MKRLIKRFMPQTVLIVLVTVFTVAAVLVFAAENGSTDNKVDLSLVMTPETQLTVYVDGALSGELSGEYSFGDTASITAPSLSGKVFSHWEADGSIISYSNPLTLTMNAHTTLYAVYANEAPTTSAVAGFTSITRTNEGDKISFQAIAGGGTVEGAGIVYSTTATGNNLKIGGGAGVTQVAAEKLTDSTTSMPDSILDDNNCWMLQIKPTGSSTVYHARAYVTVGGNTTYGDVKDVKLSELESGISMIANLEGFEPGTDDLLEEIAKNRANNPASVTNAPTAKNLNYNGQAQELVTAGTASGGEMQYALGTDATTAPANNLYTTSIPTATNAGTYYVWYKAVGDSNHTDAEAAFVEVTVAKGAIEANVTGYTGTYDGEAHGITVSVAVPQSDSQTEITIKYGTTEGEYTLSESPAFTNVSENSYTIYYEITAENYETMTGSETVTINPKEVTVTADAKSKTYGEAEPELTYTSSGLVGEDKLTGKLTREAGENAGTYAIQQGTLTGGDNYTISYTGADLTIEKAASEITKAPEANVLTYNGKEQALVTLGEAAGGTIRYALGESAAIEPAAEAYADTVPATKYSGTYYIWYKAAGDENHLDTQAQSVAVTVEPVLFGDVNFDGVVDIADALMISRYDAELTELNEKQLFAGDVDGDGEVNIADALMISRYDAGLLDKFTRTE